MSRIVAAVLSALCAAASAEGPARTEALDMVLEAAGLTQRELTPDPVAILTERTSPGTVPLLRAIQSDPLSATYRVGLAEAAFRNRLDSPHRLYMSAASLTGARISRGFLGNPLQGVDRRLLAAEDPLAEGFRILSDASMEPFDATAELPTWEELPNPARHEIARLIAAIGSAELFRRRAFRNLPSELNLDRIFEQMLTHRHTDFHGNDFRLMLGDVEWEALYAGMLDLVAAVEDFDDFLNGDPSIQPLTWSRDTPMGEVILHLGTEDSHHSSMAPLLVIDLGGDDVYFMDDTRNARTGISIVYDRKGDDIHWIEPGKGASALFGYGITWDGGGNDRYESNYMGQAAAVFGGALLYDGGGNDRFTARSCAQGFALGGAALLISMEGEDAFESVTLSQGSGGPFGVGILLNGAGNDVYTLANDPLIDPSAQSPRHNSSMGQGAGYGIRADLSDGRSVPGGVGILFDSSGDDVYTCQVFGQGVGFQEGAGILVDGGGDDRYRGVWYVQGSAAHRAAGVLLDRGEGDDVYTAELYTSIGVGHDYSVGVLLDEGGNDRFEAENLAFGAGNDNGVGLFVSAGGDDVYTLRARDGYGFGAARIGSWGSVRESTRGIGLFFALGGENAYEVQREGPAADSLWQWPRKYPELDLPCEIGMGIDGDYPNPFPTGPRTEPDGSDDKRLEEARAARRAYRAQIKEEPSPQQD